MKLLSVKLSCLKFSLLLILLVSGFSVHAHWTLDLARINFISIKNNTIGETHGFEHIEGLIDHTGKVEITIDLSSVNTGIDIRNDRMREFLFVTNDFPKAKLSTQVDVKKLEALVVGKAAVEEINLLVDLHGQQQAISINAGLVKTTDGAIHVEALSPVLLQASQFGLLGGIAKLQELAGLQAIAIR